jgi:hypothetical protein
MAEKQQEGERTLAHVDIGGHANGVTMFLVEFGIPLERVQIVPLMLHGSEHGVPHQSVSRIELTIWSYRVFFYEEDVAPEAMERMTEFLQRFRV